MPKRAGSVGYPSGLFLCPFNVFYKGGSYYDMLFFREVRKTSG